MWHDFLRINIGVKRDYVIYKYDEFSSAVDFEDHSEFISIN